VTSPSFAHLNLQADLVDEAIRSTNERYSNLSTDEFASLKQALCRFFEDKHVKVSLFLQDGIQKSDGTPPLVEEHRGDMPLALVWRQRRVALLGAP